MSRRADQVSSVLRRAIQSVLVEGLSDPRLDAMITITGVRVSGDLQEAVVSVSVAPEEKAELALHGLRAASGFIRRQAGERVAIHRPPRLVFKLDKAYRKQQEVLAAIAEVARERSEPADHPHHDSTNTQGDPGPDPAPAPAPENSQ